MRALPKVTQLVSQGLDISPLTLFTNPPSWFELVCLNFNWV